MAIDKSVMHANLGDTRLRDRDIDTQKTRKNGHFLLAKFINLLISEKQMNLEC